MSDSHDGQKSPFDLFGPPATREDPETDQGPDLSELMRQEAGGLPPGPIEGFGAEDPARVPQPGFEEAFEAPEQAELAEPAAPEEVAAEPDPVEDSVVSETVVPDTVVPDTAGDTAAPDTLASETVTPDAAPQEPEPTELFDSAPLPVAEPVPDAHPLEPQVQPGPSEVIRPPEPVGSRKLWVLRVLLFGNIAMMLVMMALPHPLEPRAQPEAEVDAGRATAGRSPLPVPIPGDSLAAPRRAPDLALPDGARYERALVLALDGRFDAACGELQGILDAAPDLNPAVERLVHAHLAYYLRKAGRLAEALEHERLARQEADRSVLPEELLREARAAQARGDGVGMRRAYAQFLLQEGQLSPEMRALIQEALLEIGDSYRIQADSGEAAAEGRGR